MTDIPDGITSEHILTAISDFEAEASHEFVDSTGYDLLHEGKRYPPKAILGLAAKQILGEPLKPSDFSGGLKSKCFRVLDDAGFEIVEKSQARSWIFQANPRIYDVVEALKHLTTVRWAVRQHQKEIHAGDQVFIWKSGSKAGIVARGKAVSEPEMLEESPEELPFNKSTDQLTEELRVQVDIAEVFDPPILRVDLKDDPALTSMAILNAPQRTNFPLTTEEAAILQVKCQRRLPPKLTVAFAKFRADPSEQLRVKLRRERAKQLREYLASVDDIGLDQFNRDVWNLETSTLLNGEEIRGLIFNLAKDITERCQEIEEALDSDSLELHGNYTWGVGSKIYGTRLKLSTEEKLANISTAIRVLNDSQIPPIEKAKQIQDVPGFGPNIATGLVMFFHPEEFAIWNKPSKEALKRLGYDASDLSVFQDVSRMLRETLGADDCIELDWFLFRMIQEEEEVPDPESSEVRSWAISLGEGGRLWKQCHAEGVIAIGWGAIGNLKQYSSKEEFAGAIANHRDDGRHPMNDSHACYQFTYEMKPGDIVFAKKGMNQLFGRGTIESDYEYDASRSEYNNIRKVKWDTAGSWEIPDGARVPLKTLTEVTAYQNFLAFTKSIVTEDNEHDPAIEIDAYTIETALHGLFVSKSRFKEMLDSLSRKKNVILQGPPGVGKTYISKRLAYLLIGEKAQSKVAMVQFHQSYSYEDFIQGWRPQESGGFERRNGAFYEFCRLAEQDMESNYVFVIDEINRGNLSKIFGELLMLIEADKRGPEYAIPLTYAHDLSDTFFIPPNVHIIGMMNTADRSLAMVDYALRRRFTFIDLVPAFDSDLFREFLDEQGVDSEVLDLIIERMSSLNEQIRSEKTNLGPGFELGHSFFCPHDTEDELGIDWYRSVIKSEIAPLLKEYWFDDTDKAEQLIAELLA